MLSLCKIKTKIRKLIVLLFLTVYSCQPVSVSAGEWNNKPVICADKEETFSVISEKEQRLFAVAKQLTKVKDPDEGNGLSDIPAILPWALYVNLETGSYTVIEYHEGYQSFCIIGFGVDFEIVPN